MSDADAAEQAHETGSDSEFRSSSDCSAEAMEEEMVVRAQSLLDGCASIDDILRRLDEAVKEYEALQSEGWELSGPVEDDYGCLVKK